MTEALTPTGYIQTAGWAFFTEMIPIDRRWIRNRSVIVPIPSVHRAMVTTMDMNTADEPHDLGFFLELWVSPQKLAPMLGPSALK